MLFFNSGTQYTLGVMFKPITSEFGWSRSAVSFVSMINMIIFAIALTIIGKLYDRFGPKWIIIISTIFVSVGFVLTSRINTFSQFFLSYGLLAAAGPAGIGVPLISTVVSKWFVKRRGLALSLALAGSSIGAFTLVPLLSFAAASYGWRNCFLYLGLAVLTVNIMLALLIIKGDPHQLTLQPFGSRNESLSEETRLKHEEKSMGARQALKTRSLWLFLVVMFICGGGDFFATTHFINVATDNNISAFTAGKMMGWFGLMSMVGVLVTGPVADRIGSKIPIVAVFTMRFILYILILNYKGTAALYTYALLFGFTQLVTAPLAPMLIGKLYGFGHIGLLTGIVNTVHFLGGGFWTYLAGVIFDRTGTYQLAFGLSAAMAFIAVICGFLIIEKRHTGSNHELSLSQ